MPKKEILFLSPVFTHNIWGGTRLRDDFGYEVEEMILENAGAFLRMKKAIVKSFPVPIRENGCQNCGKKSRNCLEITKAAGFL